MAAKALSSTVGEMTPDGSELIIHNVKNLTIKAKNPDPSATTFEALPC